MNTNDCYQQQVLSAIWKQRKICTPRKMTRLITSMNSCGCRKRRNDNLRVISRIFFTRFTSSCNRRLFAPNLLSCNLSNLQSCAACYNSYSTQYNCTVLRVPGTWSRESWRTCSLTFPVTLYGVRRFDTTEHSSTGSFSRRRSSV